jgi:hypothetical protein
MVLDSAKRVIGRVIEDLAVLVLKTSIATAAVTVVVGSSIYAIFSEDFQLAVRTNLARALLSKHGDIQTGSIKEPSRAIQQPPIDEEPQQPAVAAPAAPLVKAAPPKRRAPQPDNRGPIQRFVDTIDVFLGLKPR